MSLNATDEIKAMFRELAAEIGPGRYALRLDTDIGRFRVYDGTRPVFENYMTWHEFMTAIPVAMDILRYYKLIGDENGRTSTTRSSN